MKDFRPAQAFHPGEYIRDEMQARGISEMQMCQILAIPQSQLQDILNGNARVGVNIAEQLSRAWGTSAEVWLRLQKTYDEWSKLK